MSLPDRRNEDDKQLVLRLVRQEGRLRSRWVPLNAPSGKAATTATEEERRPSKMRSERFFQSFETLVLRHILPVVLCGLIAITVGHLFGVLGDDAFRRLLSDGLNAVLLVAIFAELRETLRDAHTEGRSLWCDLVRDFLVIALMSSVRHVLTAGAEISLLHGSHDTAEMRLQLQSIWVNGAVILGMAVAIYVVAAAGDRFTSRPTEGARA